MLLHPADQSTLDFSRFFSCAIFSYIIKKKIQWQEVQILNSDFFKESPKRKPQKKGNETFPKRNFA